MLKEYAFCLNKLIKDIVENINEFSYIEADQVAVNFKKSRNSGVEEIWAEITGLDDDHSGTIQKKEGRIEKYFAPKSLLINGIPAKYLIDFYVPVFFNLNFKQKLMTVFHELYHISPKFDGNLRFFKGKCSHHGPSLEKYDKYMDFLVDKYLQLKPSACEFLARNHEEICNVCNNGVLPKLPKPENTLFRVVWC